MSEAIAVVLTFAAVSIWNMLATRKNRANQLLMIRALLRQLDEMARSLHHEDFVTYLRATKGDECAETATINLSNLLASYSARGVD